MQSLGIINSIQMLSYSYKVEFKIIGISDICLLIKIIDYVWGYNLVRDYLFCLCQNLSLVFRIKQIYLDINDIGYNVRSQEDCNLRFLYFND